MNSYLRFFGLGIAVVALSGCLAGCQTVASVFGTEVSQDVRQNAYKGYLLALSVWADGVQPAILVYKRRPYCAPEVTVICRNRATWEKIQTIEGRTSAMIERTRPVITGGTTDIELITNVAAAVWDAKTQLEAAKAEPKEP
jgi:hypothetical protein